MVEESTNHGSAIGGRCRSGCPKRAAGTEQTEGVRIADTDDANADAQDDSATDDDSDFVDAATSSTAAIPTLPEPDGTTIAVTRCESD